MEVFRHTEQPKCSLIFHYASSTSVSTMATKASSKEYTPFARKYRPSNFAELKGQEVLVKTLDYCIREDRLAQSYLLTGIRGVGKTSTARIIARTINCEKPSKKADLITPCDKCKNCESTLKGAHPDVLEIDAASHTSVDDIRKVIESSEYRPLLGKYKLFIIDEVHMLSKSAFNALLKIVEEPPAHVIFIFATTEVQKIPVTVISRCQRYDLRRFSFTEIVELLESIAKKEKLKVSPEALKLIASKSEGSARDATAILDQAASYVMNNDGESEISEAIISHMLGLAGLDTVLKLAQRVILGDSSGALEAVDEIYASSSSLELFIANVADFIAELSKRKLVTTYHNPLHESISKEITDLLIGISLSRLSMLWQIFSSGVAEIKQSHNEKLTAEMVVIKAIHACSMPTPEKLLKADIALTNSGARQVSSIAAEASNAIDNDIYDFLKFCYQKNEIDVYYCLLNDVEVVKFSSDILELAGSTPSSIQEKMKKLLLSWSGREYGVTCKKSQEIVSLKNRMLEEVKLSEDFNVIKNKFPSANISDIILESK